MGVTVDPTSGLRISRMALRIASRAALAGVAVHHDVFHHHDRVVDHQTRPPPPGLPSVIRLKLWPSGAQRDEA